MGSFPEANDWRPPYGYPDIPHAILRVTSAEGDGWLSWIPSGSAELDAFAGDFLNGRLADLSESDLLSEANFLYVVFRRAPSPEDTRMQVGRDTPIAEFGYGGPPRSPEEWPVVELRTLLESAIRKLRGKD